MSEVLKIYNADGTSFYDAELESYTFSDTALEFDTSIEGSFVSELDLWGKFTNTEWVEYQVNPTGDKTKFYLVNAVTRTRSGDMSGSDKGLWRYSCKFNDVSIELETMPFKNKLQGLSSFSFAGSALDLIYEIESSLTNGWTVSFYDIDSVPTTVPDDVLTFSDATIASGLNTLYDEFGVTYTKADKVIWIGKPTIDVGHDFSFGDGLKTDNATPKNNDVITMVTPIGVETNIPYPYPKIYDSNGDMITTYKFKNSSGDIVSRQVNRYTLMPPIYRSSLQAQVDNLLSDDSNIDDYPVIDYYTTDDIEDPVTLYNPDLPANGSVTADDDIKPSIEGMTYNDVAIDELVGVSYQDGDNDTVDYDTGDVEVATFYLTLPPMGFDIWASAAVTGEMTFSMKSGDTIGANYAVAVDDDEWESNFYTTYYDTDEDVEALETAKTEAYAAYSEAKSNWTSNYGELQYIEDLTDFEFSDSYADNIYWIAFGVVWSPDFTDEQKLQYDAAYKDYLQVVELYEAYTTANTNYYTIISGVESSVVFEANSEKRDYDKFPDSTDQSITIEVFKDIDTFGELMPSDILGRPVAGDKYVIIGIELPLSYILTAESKLKEYALEYLADNNYHQYTYPLTLDEGYLYENPEIARQITTNATLTFSLGGEYVTQPIESLTKSHGVDKITTYSITVTDELEANVNAVTANASAIKDLTTVVTTNAVANTIASRRNSYATQQALNGIFDSEGNNRIDDVEARVVYANAALYGQNANDFSISGGAISFNNSANTIGVGVPATIAHNWADIVDNEDYVSEWVISNVLGQTLDPDEQYYLYVVANRINSTAFWEVSTEQHTYDEDEDVFYFFAGQVIWTSSGWTFVATHGMTSILGGTITTQVTKSPNYELTEDTFTGMMIDFLNARIYMGEGAAIVTRKITISSPDAEDYDVSTAITTAQESAAQAALEAAAAEAAAAEAAEAAEAAASTISAVNDAITAINSDDIFSIDEKLAARTTWEAISGRADVDHTPSEADSSGSYKSAIAVAEEAGVSTTVLTAAYQALIDLFGGSNITIAYGDDDTVITYGDDNATVYYGDDGLLLYEDENIYFDRANYIATLSAYSNAETGVRYGVINAAAVGGEAYLAELGSLDDDGEVSVSEKVAYKSKWETIDAEHSGYLSAADAYSVDTEACEDAYESLEDYLYGSDGLLNDLTTAAAVTPNSVDTYFVTYYSKRSLLKEATDAAIDAAAQGYVDDITPTYITIDATSLSESVFYPIVFKSISTTEKTTFVIKTALSSAYGSPSWATHSSTGFIACCTWSAFGYGYGTRSIERIISEYSLWWVSVGSVIGSIGQMTNSSTEYIYVRGGAKYDVAAYTASGNIAVSKIALVTSSYTASSQTISTLTSITVPVTQSTSLTTAQTTADSKSATYSQASMPSSANLNDTWYDTTNSYVYTCIVAYTSGGVLATNWAKVADETVQSVLSGITFSDGGFRIVSPEDAASNLSGDLSDDELKALAYAGLKYGSETASLASTRAIYWSGMTPDEIDTFVPAIIAGTSTSITGTVITADGTVYSNKIVSASGTFTDATIEDGTIGGFALADGRIGAVSAASTSDTTTGLSIYDGFIRFKDGNLFGAIGSGLTPSSAGTSNYVGWLSNTTSNVLGTNNCLQVDCSGGTYNIAIRATGAIASSTLCTSYGRSLKSLTTASSDYIASISDGTNIIVTCYVSSSNLGLPRRDAVAYELGLGLTTPFSLKVVFIGHRSNTQNFYIYGRVSSGTYSNSYYPYRVDNNGSTVTGGHVMAAGDSATFLLDYDGTDYYAYLVNYQQ